MDSPISPVRSLTHTVVYSTSYTSATSPSGIAHTSDVLCTCICDEHAAIGYFCLVCRSFASLCSLKTTAACNCRAHGEAVNIRILNFPAFALLRKVQQSNPLRKGESGQS